MLQSSFWHNQVRLVVGLSDDGVKNLSSEGTDVVEDDEVEVFLARLYCKYAQIYRPLNCQTFFSNNNLFS